MRIRIFALLMFALLSITPFVSAQGVTLTLGQIVSGEITNAKPADTYTFSGRAGDAIVITMNATGSGLDSYVRVTAPDGTQYFNDDSNGSLNSTLPLLLQADGAYTITATRCCGDENQFGSEGTYELQVNTVTIEALTTGESVTITLPADQNAVFASFTGTPGQILRLDAIKNSGAALFIIDVREPNGAIINSVAEMENQLASIDPIFVNTSGQYLFTITRQYMLPEDQLRTEPISVNLTLVDVQSTPTTVGSTLTGTLNNQSPAAYYTFQGTSSDLLRLTGERISGTDFDVSIYNSAGMGFGGSSTLYGAESGSFVLDPLQLTESGTFLLVVRRTSMPDGSEQTDSQYSVTLEMTRTPILQTGQPIQGSFAPNTYENVYRYEGTAGQSVRISIRSMTPDYAPALSIQGPTLLSDPNLPEGYTQTFYAQISGNTSATATYEVVLPVDGSYLFRVGNGNYSPDGQLKGSYVLQVDVAQ